MLSNKLKKYEKYKRSGIEWIGEIPNDWEVKKLKFLVSPMGKSTFQASLGSEDGLYPFFTSSQKLSKKYNEAIYNLEGLILGTGGSANLHYYFGEFSTSTDCLVLNGKKKDCSYKFIYYFLQGFLKLIDDLGFEGMGLKHLQRDFLYNFYVLSFNKKEQQVIADYLDNKISQIDQIINKRKDQINLLNERRISIINKAVTKGLNENVEMKDSGVEWIGMIPKHWEVRKLKYTTKKLFKYGANEGAEYDDINLPRFIRITDIDNNGNLRDNTFKSLPYEIAKNFFLDDGDILFARSGATVGKTFKYKSEWGLCCFAGYLIKYSSNKKICNPDYVYFITKSSIYEDWKNSIFIQSTIQNISAEKYKSFILPIPNILEQQEIVDYLDKKTSQIDKTISKLEESIKYLEEYKTSLISNVITGKIKVC